MNSANKDNTIKYKYGKNQEIEMMKIPIHKVSSGSNKIRKGNSTTMYHFDEANKRNELPSSTSIYCWWCCHPFNNQPCVLPLKYEKEVYHVMGCFCSPECAAAYNFDTDIDMENNWERYSLLNDLYKRVYKNEEYEIKLAPPRIALSVFGGSMSIDEFRQLNSDYNINYKIIMPPVTSIIPQIEESNLENNSNQKESFIPIDKERIKKANEELRLKRNKPITESTNTLENCMRLKYI